MTMWTRVKTWWAGDAPLGIIERHLPPEERECPHCHCKVYIWRTFTDGTVLCVPCSDQR